VDTLLSVDRDDWRDSMVETSEYFSTFGKKFPAALTAELEAQKKRLG
jgi:GTP-dependent phosphoenolpyruvate carboxykinase